MHKSRSPRRSLDTTKLHKIILVDILNLGMSYFMSHDRIPYGLHVLFKQSLLLVHKVA